MIACITAQGAYIHKKGHRLLVCAADETHTLFVDELEQVLLFGNIQLSPQARYLLLKERIDTVFLRTDGRYMGRLESEESANVFLRKKQFLLNDDAGFCLGVARDIVHAKLMNQASLLARVKRERHAPEAGQAARELRALAREALNSADLQSARGIEGAGAALYFRHLPLAFHKDWKFTRRTRRPPTDPVNVVLSFLYTLLTSRCHAACRILGLDPFPGCLHDLEYGRHSLPLDLVEEFRALVADSLTIALFNMNVLHEDDFEPAVADGDAAISSNEEKAKEAGGADNGPNSIIPCPEGGDGAALDNVKWMLLFSTNSRFFWLPWSWRKMMPLSFIRYANIALIIV